ncbi:MAG: AAA family ATPase, partial [Actinomycetota bacterium]|nr:AAA family ATPase [Actinomycetota bacterium]
RAAVDRLARAHDVTLVEGAGGVLVRLAPDLTLLDLCADVGAPVVVVVPPGLGALNHAELTVGAVRARGVRVAGLVIGSWPAEPDLAMRCNRDDLPRLTGTPVGGVIPAGAGSLSPAEFGRRAASWFDPDWLARELALVPPAADPASPAAAPVSPAAASVSPRAAALAPTAT